MMEKLPDKLCISISLRISTKNMDLK